MAVRRQLHDDDVSLKLRAEAADRRKRGGTAALAWHLPLVRALLPLARAWPLLLVAYADPARAADPVPYSVAIAPTGDAVLDGAAKDAAALISLAKSAPVGPFALVARARGDVGRLTDALHSRGYYLGSIAIRLADRALDDTGLPAALEAASGAPPVRVEIVMTPGPQFTIGRIDLKGDTPPGSQALLGLRPGDPALAANVLAAGQRLMASLQAQGRALAKVAAPVATLDVTSRTLNIVYEVDAGPRVDLGAITFAGDTQVRPSYLRRRFQLEPGQPYDPAALEHARQDLANVPAVASVRLETPEALDSVGRLPVRVVVADRPRRAVDLGASYSTDQGGVVSANWTHRNLFGNAERLRLSLATTQLGSRSARQPGYDASALLAIPDILERAQSLSVNLRAVRESLDAYDRTAALAGVMFDRQINEQLAVGAGLSGAVAEITQEGVRRTYRLIQLPLTSRYDTTDSLLDPTTGLRLALFVTPTHSLGTTTTKDSSFVIVQGSAATYLDVGEWLGARRGRGVLAVRGLAGTISGAGAFDIPPDQRFYAGGGGTVRGFRFQSIGPTFPDRRPAGGTSVQVGSIEWRQRFGESFGAVAFVDAGQVGGGASNLTGSGVLRVGAGLGGRYYTSFGPIRVDVAVPLNKSGAIKTDIVEAYIGIGQAF